MSSKARGLADLGNAYDDGALSNRNLITNGAMQVAQRGTSKTGDTGISGYKTVDRFKVNNDFPSGVTSIAYSQDTDAPDGFSSSLKIQPEQSRTAALSGADRLFLNHSIEAQNLQHLSYGSASAKTLTISFLVKSNLTGIVTVEFSNPDTPNANFQLYHETVTINAANTWEYKTVSIAGNANGGIDNDNGTGLGITWSLAAGPAFTSGTFSTGVWHDTTAGNRASPSNIDLYSSSSNYFQLTGVQLEVGDTATPFEHRSYGDELARCQRYFCEAEFKANLSAHASACRIGGTINFPTTMRASPSISSIVDSSGPQISSVDVSAATVNCARAIFVTNSSFTNAECFVKANADAEL